MPVKSAAGEELVVEAPGLSQDEVKLIAQAKRVSLIDYMREWLAAQPKRKVKVRAESDVFVQINGYSVLIQPGVPVDVPEPIAVLLEQADYI